MREKHRSVAFGPAASPARTPAGVRTLTQACTLTDGVTPATFRSGAAHILLSHTRPGSPVAFETDFCIAQKRV